MFATRWRPCGVWCGELGPCYVGKGWSLPSITLQNTFPFSLLRLIAGSCASCGCSRQRFVLNCSAEQTCTLYVYNEVSSVRSYDFLRDSHMFLETCTNLFNIVCFHSALDRTPCPSRKLLLYRKVTYELDQLEGNNASFVAISSLFTRPFPFLACT
jgi:hypothetical protein